MDCELLENEGYVVLKGLVPKAACARARALIDSTFGPKGESAVPYLHSQGEELSNAHYVGGRAPADDANFWDSAGPFLQSNNFYHDMRHPIRSATPAECLPPALVEAMQTALRSTRADIKLSQQYWVRTDYRPPPYNDHPGMHLDHACLPWQREATPSQHYYLCQVALCDIPPGGAATLVSPAAFRRAKATAARLQHEEPEWCAALDDEQFRTTLTGKVGEQPEHDELKEVVRRPHPLTCHGSLLLGPFSPLPDRHR